MSTVLPEFRYLSYSRRIDEPGKEWNGKTLDGVGQIGFL